MSFEIELANANDVTYDCIARAIEYVMEMLPGRLIEEIWFNDDDTLIVELFGEVREFAFPIIRHEVHYD